MRTKLLLILYIIFLHCKVLEIAYGKLLYIGQSYVGVSNNTFKSTKPETSVLYEDLLKTRMMQ